MDYKQEYNRVCDQLRFTNSKVDKMHEFIAFISFADGTYSYNSYSSRLDWVQDVKNNFCFVEHCIHTRRSIKGE